jgi:hypothetical protein
LFPLLAGLSLFAYLDRWQIFSNLTPGTLLRWLQFLGTYVACNIFLDELQLRSRWQRVVIATILVLSLGPLQDAYPRTTYFQSEELREGEFWKNVTGELTTRPDTKLLILRVQRLPPGRPIRGKLWIDDFRLAEKQPPGGEQ